VHPIAAVQNEYSLLYRKDGEETLRTTRELGIALVAYAPLGRSMLSGAVRAKADVPEGDRRLAHPRFQGENLDRNLELVAKLEKIGRRRSAPSGSSCSPGCWRKARTSSRFRDQAQAARGRESSLPLK